PPESGIETEPRERGAGRFAEARFQVAHGFGGVAGWAVVVPALARKRLPWRLKSAISGVTSKPTRTSKLAPDTLISLRGMVMPPSVSVTCTRSRPAGKVTGRPTHSLARTAALRCVTAPQ